MSGTFVGECWGFASRDGAQPRGKGGGVRVSGRGLPGSSFCSLAYREGCLTRGWRSTAYGMVKMGS